MTDVAKSPAAVSEQGGMGYLVSLPRRVVTIYLPLAIFLFVLLFPFYWMGVTTFKPNEELYNYSHHNPLWIDSPTLANIRKLLFETDYPQWLRQHHDGRHLLPPFCRSSPACSLPMRSPVCGSGARRRSGS